MEKYDYFKCEICGKYKPTGCELVRKLAYSKWIPEAQNEAKKEARKKLDEWISEMSK